MEQKYQIMPLKAKAYIGTVSAAGIVICAVALMQWSPSNLTRALCFLVVSAIASALKVTLPTITGTMSVNFLFILIGIVELDFPSTLIIGCTGSLIQCLWKSRTKPKPFQVIFNTGVMAISVAASYYIYHANLAGLASDTNPVRMGITACVFFLINTIPVAAAIGITESKSLTRIWYDCYFWCFPYYLGGASIAWILSVLSRQTHWHASLVLIPVIYFIYRSYRTYLGRLEDEKVHVEEMAALHLRTIEALALAIEAKDHTTHDHLRRVRIYAMEVAKDLGLPASEMQALRAAALLHDIGKLAVPEQIISKPGKLTPEEFEKIKIHPVVGAEILERVQFPYPVVPIVRAHHEKWDGSGYPAGLKGEEIPIGARILSAVDCLDALASNRQYRRALPLDRAMEIITSEAGKSFDARVVEVLSRRYKELEQMALAQNWDKKRLSTHVKIEKGLAPAAGFEKANTSVNGRKDAFDPLSSIAAARQEVQMLFELTQDLGNSLSLNETLSVVSVRLKRLVPYDSIAVYVLRDGKLVPEYVNGENFRLFSSLEIPVGEGLSGWVAQNRKPILNGNPSVEAGYMGDPGKFSTLRSALAVPLEGLNGAVGVLALYRAEKDAFTKDNLRILLAISSKVSLAIENALKYRQVENSATIDYLTNLPNARSLFLRLDSELARCRRMNIPLAVLVCDLDGFKQVNDSFGHLTGNKVLSSVANGLKANCREYDYVARMGGDEFVLLLPHITADSVDERITQMVRIAAEAGEIAPGKRFLSMSVGEAFYPLDGNNAEELLATADRRMYKNKQQQKLRQANTPAVMKEPALAALSVQ
ncbi:MAG: diguanylate cyclase and metal dependent phosphohydrolase [Bryobacterales bacterium]|nr:diguanylate cyclase and metal dependent phosphohydrolase [Bryobacterales bacterium]